MPEIKEESTFKKFTTNFKKVVTNEEFQKAAILTVIQVTTLVVVGAAVTAAVNGINKGVTYLMENSETNEMPEPTIIDASANVTTTN